MSDETEKPVPGGPAEASSEPAPTQPPAAEAPAPKRKALPPSLIRAFRTGRAIEGKIEKVIKGGYEVKIGRARGFCPHSQIALEREDDPESKLGETYLFRVTQIRRGGEDVVLSRRAILEEQRAEEAKAVRATLIKGAVMRGRVAGIATFGAFVDLGAGVQGLAHISELSHRRVTAVDQAVKAGDTVQVRILSLNDSTGKISLSIRQAEEDPWAGIAKRFEPGKVYPGSVTRLADFGAFVELAPGVEALAPASEFPPVDGGWNAGLEIGTSGDWYVLSVDARARRISLTPPGDATEPLPPLEEKAELRGKVQRVERYGIFVWLGPGRVGLMPRALSGAPEGADLRRRFSIGADVEVTVVEITEGGRRIRLAKKGVRAKPEDRPAERPARSEREETKPDEPPESFGTSLADKLRAALERADDS